MTALETLRNTVQRLVIESLATTLEERRIAHTVSPGSPIYGRESPLDSLGLVAFIVDVEAQLEAELGVVVTIANEKAVARAHSPFRDVPSLVEYIVTLIEHPNG